MVDDLMAARRAANDDQVFKFVSDVVADQTTEIGRMELLLRSIPRP
jgi:ferritin